MLVMNCEWHFDLSILDSLTNRNTVLLCFVASCSPRFCHRLVGYVEEEACSTYTKIIKAIESAPEGSELAAWRTEAPPKIAQAYWKLHGKTVLDLMYAVRADEAEHRDVNHLISGVKDGQINPLYNPESKLDTMLSKYVAELMRPGKN